MSKIPGGRVADARPAQMPPFTNFCRRKEAYASTEKANEKDSPYMVEKKTTQEKRLTRVSRIAPHQGRSPRRQARIVQLIL